MPDLQRVHRFRDYAVAGVNWRPTRFVDEVPSSRVCGLCRMIPKRILVLPCGHVLCQPCHAASSQGGRCPLDQHPFDEAECCAVDFPVGKAKPLKVHCWNEAHGCQFEGTVEAMLRHYENECTFHTVECLRCGEEVLHRELSTHCAAGCRVVASTAGTENTSSECTEVKLQVVTAAVEELKTLLRDVNSKQQLLAIQIQINGLIEQIRNKESSSAVIPHDVAAPSTSELAQVAAPSTSRSLQEGNSRQDPNEEATTPSTSRSRQKNMSKRSKTEPLVDLPREVLQAMRKTSSQVYPQHAITRFSRKMKCRLKLTSPLSTTVTWRKVLGTVKYVLTLQNFPMESSSLKSKFADFTVLHTKDAYFTVQVYCRPGPLCDLCVAITFHGMRGDYRCPPPVFVVKAYNMITGKFIRMNRDEKTLDCNHDRHSWAHCHHIYYKYFDSLKYTGNLLDGLKFEIGLRRR
ncbi:TNF receptor-associated factor 3-like isoform X2 [Rhipicephalus sanguineus]|uniref:TNF receptor-associated factor 3-like isoform X2 n=1 Tax=Rhipicephalus sanguineus TaxID=34632 RepID=UPI0020C31734|nr:TNF receptor-associated factor 3-like isoform X2 [Rhipicephalus sanguineus]